MSAWMGQARTRMPRFAGAAVERARLTVVPRRPTPVRRVPFVILVSLVLLAGVVGLLLFNTSMQQASFRATELERRAAVLYAQQQQLKLELDALRDPQRVAVEARRLGMVPVSSPAFIRLSDGRVLGNPEVATGAGSFRLRSLPSRKPAHFERKPVLAPPVDVTPTVEPGDGRARDDADGAASRRDRGATGRKSQAD